MGPNLERGSRGVLWYRKPRLQPPDLTRHGPINAHPEVRPKPAQTGITTFISRKWRCVVRRRMACGADGLFVLRRYVFGMKGDVSDNICYVDESTVLYPAGHNTVL